MWRLAGLLSIEEVLKAILKEVLRDIKRVRRWIKYTLYWLKQEYDVGQKWVSNVYLIF